MSKNSIELVLTAVLAAERGGAPMTEADGLLCYWAGECDRLRTRIAKDSEEMGERFGRFAADMADPRRIGQRAFSPPTSYSTLREIERNSAELDAKLEALFTMLGMRSSDLAKKVTQALLEAARAAEGK